MSKKRIVMVIFLSIVCVLICSGCCIQHDWQPATCTQPETCGKCGKTKGEALGHTWIAATCTEPKTCSTCGATSGTALGHEYDPTSDDFVCTRCNEERVFTYKDMDQVLYGIKDDYSSFKKMYIGKKMVMQITADGKRKPYFRSGMALVDGDVLMRTIRNPEDKSEKIDVVIEYVAKDSGDLKNVNTHSMITVRARLDEVMAGWFSDQYYVTFDKLEIVSNGWQNTLKS